MVQVLCDFDGTVAVEDVTDGLLVRFATSEWQDIEQAWRRGEIGSRECMRNQVALIRAELSAIDRYLDTVEIDPHFCDFADFCEAQGIGLRLVSDGVDYAIRRVLRRHGLDHLSIVANALDPVGHDRYRLSFPFAARGCSAGAGTCKCDIAKSAGAADARSGMTILIGDGVSDFCAAGTVDLVFAKEKLLAHCRAHGLPHVRFANFKDARNLLAEIASEPSMMEGTL